MVRVKEDMTGWKMWEHGVPNSRLIVKKQIEDYVSPSGERCSQWLCECTCNKHTEVKARGKDLRNGDKTSCGCLSTELRRLNAKKYNKYNLSGEYGIGWTNNTNTEFYFDLEDFDKIKDYCWYEYTDHNDYHSIRANNNGTTTSIQWIIAGKYYDHINRNPFDNRKENLRKVSRSENSWNQSKHKNNTSGFIGVHFDKTYGYWIAQIGYKNKRIKLGNFSTKYDAIIARLTAELKYFGLEFAPQRHLFDEYNIIYDKEGT